MMRAIRTRAALVSGWQLRAISRARTAATSCWAIARLADYARRCAYRYNKGHSSTRKHGSRTRSASAYIRIFACARMSGRMLSRFRFFLVPPPAARARAAQRAGDRAQVVEDASPAFGAGERSIERSHGAIEAGLLIIHPNRQHAREHQGCSLRAQGAARAGRGDAGSLQHPELRAYSHGVEREGEAGMAPS